MRGADAALMSTVLGRAVEISADTDGIGAAQTAADALDMSRAVP